MFFLVFPSQKNLLTKCKPVNSDNVSYNRFVSIGGQEIGEQGKLGSQVAQPSQGNFIFLNAKVQYSKR